MSVQWEKQLRQWMRWEGTILVMTWWIGEIELIDVEWIVEGFIGKFENLQIYESGWGTSGRGMIVRYMMSACCVNGSDVIKLFWG